MKLGLSCYKLDDDEIEIKIELFAGRMLSVSK